MSMGRPPKQKGLKEYLVNPRTRFLFSDAAEFREVFKKGEDHIYLTRAEGGKRLGKGTFRIIGHLPQKHNQKRDEYEQEKAGGGMSRFLRGGPLEASRMRYDAGSYPGFHLIVHTQDGKRQEFYLTSESRYGKGSLVYGTVTIPSKKNRQLVVCPVRLGHFGVSASKPGQYKLSLQKPKTMCGVSFIKAGHVGEETGKKWDEKSQTVKAAESGDIYISEAESSYFYAAQGIDLLSVQDVEVSASENQTRAWSNPADAMTGNETLEGYETIDSVNVDLSSNQPIMNLGAEDGVAAPDYDPEDYSVVTNPNDYNPKAMPDQYCAEDIPVAEGTSLKGYEPVDSVLEEAPIGHGVTQNFGGEGLEDFDPVASVVVEPPLGHGAPQWYAEGDDPQPPEPEGVTGQDGPSADPTNSNFTAQGYDDREDESIGMRHRGGHKQSRKDRRDEAAGMERHGGRRKYSNVGTMDLSAENLSRGSKSSFWRGKGGHLYALDNRGRFITHNAEFSKGKGGRNYARHGKGSRKGGRIITHDTESFSADLKKLEKEMGCDLCGGDLIKIENSEGQLFYYCPNEESPNDEEEACNDGHGSAEGKWITPDGMYYNGVVGSIDEPKSAHLRSPCSECDNWYVVSENYCGTKKRWGPCIECPNCCECYTCETCDKKVDGYETPERECNSCSAIVCNNCIIYDDKEDTMLCNDCHKKSLSAESAFDKLEGTIEDEYLEKGYSPKKAKQIAGGAAYKAGVRSHGGGKKGKAWMRRAAKRGMKAEAGYIGDMTLEGYQPMDSIEVDRSSYQPTQDYGAEAGYIGDMTLEGYQPIDSVEVDRSSYQPTQDYGADFTLEKPVTTGFLVSLGAFCFAGAAILGTVLLGSLLMKDE
jgi:hypothetical protein